jgi:multidrug resistance efflux pump
MDFLRHQLQKLEEDLVGPGNSRVFLVWCCAVVVLIGVGFYLNGDSVSILGVAESREYQVNFDRPVAIKQIHVLNGQNVKKGDLLLELNQSELEMQLYMLKSRADKLSAELKLRDQISSVVQDGHLLPKNADPLRIEWQDTQREKGLVEERLKNLFVFAEVDGQVGAVNFKVGEKVPAFSPILTLLPPTPTYVNGYINENLYSQIEVGQSIEVASVSGAIIRGRVLSLGSRIVPIPERLLRIHSLPAWGREVVVQIPAKNSFLIGEKVSMRRPLISTFFKVAQADEIQNPDAGIASDPEKIEIPEEILESFQPEISGMVYIPELKKFILVSDDYPKNKPVLLLMNDAGQVQKEVLPIEGLDKMEDIESLSYQNSKLYLMSSLSPTKSGVSKQKRQLFASVIRKDMNFQLLSQIDLREALLKALQSSQDEVLQNIAKAQYELEVEGHAIRNNDLYLALKNPIGISKEFVILKIRNFEDVFKNIPLTSDAVSVAYRVTLPATEEGVQVLVTDMIFFNNQIFLASSFKGQDRSAIWKIDEQNNTINLIQEFKRKHLEALGILTKSCRLYGIFEGKEGNFVTTLSLPAVKKGSECY